MIISPLSDFERKVDRVLTQKKVLMNVLNEENIK